MSNSDTSRDGSESEAQQTGQGWTCPNCATSYPDDWHQFHEDYCVNCYDVDPDELKELVDEWRTIANEESPDTDYARALRHCAGKIERVIESAE